MTCLAFTAASMLLPSMDKMWLAGMSACGGQGRAVDAMVTASKPCFWTHGCIVVYCSSVCMGTGVLWCGATVCAEGAVTKMAQVGMSCTLENAKNGWALVLNLGPNPEPCALMVGSKALLPAGGHISSRWGSFSRPAHCRGKWALGLLQYTTTAWGSGQWVFFITLPHFRARRAMGSFSTMLHYKG